MDSNIITDADREKFEENQRINSEKFQAYVNEHVDICIVVIYRTTVEFINAFSQWAYHDRDSAIKFMEDWLETHENGIYSFDIELGDRLSELREMVENEKDKGE